MLKNAIVLTGSIATGKSTVGAFLKMYGYSIISADKITHEILAKEANSIADIFGREYILDSKVNRSKLGSLIFSDKDAKAKLESFMHPKIKDEIEIQAQKIEKFNCPYFIEIPLFFETGNYEIENSLVVYTPKYTQLKRLIEREGFTQEDAKSRLNSQIDIEDKKAKATYLIDNSKDLKHLQNECEKFVNMLKGR